MTNPAEKRDVRGNTIKPHSVEAESVTTEDLGIGTSSFPSQMHMELLDWFDADGADFPISVSIPEGRVSAFSYLIECRQFSGGDGSNSRLLMTQDGVDSGQYIWTTRDNTGSFERQTDADAYRLITGESGDSGGSAHYLYTTAHLRPAISGFGGGYGRGGTRVMVTGGSDDRAADGNTNFTFDVEGDISNVVLAVWKTMPLDEV